MWSSASGAVIALVAVGQGAQAQVVSQFSSLGANMLTVQAGSQESFSRQGVRTTVRSLNMTDVEAIQGLATAGEQRCRPSTAATARWPTWARPSTTSVTGVTPEYAARPQLLGDVGPLYHRR